MVDIASQNKGYVKLPSSYFSKAKLEYGNWQVAWFREALQNAFRVISQDDGCGMDKDKLLNVFLSMGGSVKAEGAIGGFGYAKVLLAFAHQRYKIDSSGIRVSGESGDYVWNEHPTDHPGVRLEVDMTTDDCHISTMMAALHEVVHNSRLPPDVKVTLNDEHLLPNQIDHPYQQKTTLGQLTFKDLPHGYSNSNLWVRMNGLAMFRARLWMGSGTAFEGYLELEGSSKEMLTSNRDSLSGDHGEILNQLMQTLANDRQKLKLSGDIDITLNQSDIAFEAMSSRTRREFDRTAAENNLSAEDLLALLDAATDDLGNEAAQHPFLSLAKQVKKDKNKLDEKINKIPNAWYPTNFRVKYSDEDSNPESAHKHASAIASSMSLKRNGKLAYAWERLIHTLLENEGYREALGVDKRGDHFYHRRNLIQTGFVFGKPIGLNVSECEEQRASILINPDFIQKHDFSIGDVIDVAHHELTHLDCESHSEYFTTKEFELRRIARRDIGERNLINAFTDATVEWRNKHSETGATKSKRNNDEDFGLN
jgi:hypothetical protein